MYHMDQNVIVHETEKTVARATIIAFDNRSRKEVSLVIYVELEDETDSVKPYAEKALKEMGYTLLGISDVETATIPFDAEVAWEQAKEREEAQKRKGL